MSQEYPCIYYDNQKCKKLSEDGVTSWCVLGPCSGQTLSNADRIRAMSDDELAWELMTWRCEAEAKHHGISSVYPDTQSTILAWLQQPVKEE